MFRRRFPSGGLFGSSVGGVRIFADALELPQVVPTFVTVS